MVLVVIFLAVAFYVYNTYIAPKINPDFVPNREFKSEGEIKEATLYFLKWIGAHIPKKHYLFGIK